MIFSKRTSATLLTLLSTSTFAQSVWVSKVPGNRYVLSSVLWTGESLMAMGTGASYMSTNGEQWIEVTGSHPSWVFKAGTEIMGMGSYGSAVPLPSIVPYSVLCTLFDTHYNRCNYSVYFYYGLYTFTDNAWQFSPGTLGEINANIGYTAAVAWTDSVSNLLVAVGMGNKIATSQDKSNWTLQSSGTLDSLFSVVWSGNQFVAVGAHGVIQTSSDGASWTIQTSGTTESLFSVVWSGSTTSKGSGQAGSPQGGAQFVVVGSGGMILTSSNGINWEWQTSGTGKSLRSIIWSGSEFVAVGDGGAILTSTDGFNWISQISGTERNLLSAAWAGTQYVAVGDSGAILTSQIGEVYPVENPTSIASFSNSSAKLSLHLTPSTLLVDLPNSMIGKQIRATIYTVNGNKVRSVQTNGSDHHVSLPVTSVPPGIYLFEVAGPDVRVVQSFHILR